MPEFAIVAVGFVVCAYLALQGWAIVLLRAQAVRPDARSAASTPRGRPAAAAATPTAQRGPIPVDLASPFALTDLDGRTVTSAGLLARGRPLILLPTDPRCGPCYELLPDVGRWQRDHADRATVVLVSSGTAAANRAMTAEFGIDPGLVLLQQGFELVEALRVEQAPAALIFAPDSRPIGPVAYGAEGVRAAVADALGVAFRPSVPAEFANLRADALAPALRRPDLDGEVVDLAAWRGDPTVVLFWSPGCNHCQELLPRIVAWNPTETGARLLVVSRGPAGLNRDAIATVPVVLDDDRSLATAFGVTGTPAAVLIDREGVVAAEVARGARAVHSLLDGVVGRRAASPVPA